MVLINLAAYFFSKKGLLIKIFLITSPTIAVSFLLGIMFTVYGMTLLTGAVFFVGSMAASSGLIYGLFRWVIKPINSVAEIGYRIAEGDLDQHITVVGRDEIGYMQASIAGMLAYLQETAALAEQIADGNLDVHVKLKSDKDQLGQAMRNMVISLRRLLQQIKDGLNTLTITSLELDTTARTNKEAATHAAMTVEQVAEGTGQQAYKVGQAAELLKQMQTAIDGIARGAQEQAAAVGTSATLTGQIAQAIGQVAGNTQQGAQGAAQAAKTAQTGAATVENNLQGMEAISNKTRFAMQKVTEMGEQSERIGDIVKTIDDIASQTNLLALNAAIETARATAQSRNLAEELLDQIMAAQAYLLAELLTIGKKDWTTAYWNQVANQAGIDNICITDEDGTVVFSEDAGLLGFRFLDDPQSQTYEFRQLLRQKNGVVCQPAQARSIDNKLFKYVGVSRRDQPGIVQVGFHAKSLGRFQFQMGGFGVVADEVRKLAEKSAIAAKEITALIQTNRQTVKEASQAMAASAAEVETGVAKANEAHEALTSILQAIVSVSQQVDEIAVAAQQIDASINNLSGTMETVSAVVEENTASTEEMSAGAGDVTTVMEDIALVSNENAAAVDELNTNINAITTQAQQVDVSVQELNGVAQTLQSQFEHFKLPAN